MASSSWVRSSLTTVGRPKQARVLMWRISSSIGRTCKPPVRKVIRVLVGAKPESAWKSSLPERSVPLVRCAASARSHQPPVGCYMCVHKPLTKPCRHGDKNKRHQRFGKRIRDEQASREPSHKQYAGWGYDAHVMMACTRHMCNTS